MSLALRGSAVNGRDGHTIPSRIWDELSLRYGGFGEAGWSHPGNGRTGFGVARLRMGWPKFFGRFASTDRVGVSYGDDVLACSRCPKAETRSDRGGFGQSSVTTVPGAGPRRTCLENILTTDPRGNGPWSKSRDAVCSIVCLKERNWAMRALLSVPVMPASSSSAASLIWHCTTCASFSMENLNAKRS